MRQVVITGMGCVTPYGAGIDVFWESILRGRSGIRRLSAFDPAPYGSQVAGEVPDFHPRDYLPAKDVSATSRCVQFAVAAARMAVSDAKLPLPDPHSDRIGVFFGSSVGTFQYAAENHAVFLEKGIRRVHPLFPAQSTPGAIASQIAITFGIRGPAFCFSTACTSSTDAVGMAWLHIRAGLVDRAIVGGSEAPITPLLFASFDRLGVMSRGNDAPECASRPFAADRDGFVISEGAGACVLEAAEAAEARGASPLAEVAGYAATSDGFHPFSPLPTGEEGARAIRLALEAGCLDAGSVDYVNAHAIGSKANDPIEVGILKRIFGERGARTPVSSIKSMIGHSMGAAGILELIACTKAIDTSTLPPTINVASGDIADGLDLIRDEPRRATADVVLSTTFGFGARNAVLVVKRYGH